MKALAWLDWHIAVNRVRSLLQAPRRLVPWLFVVLMIGGGMVSRLAGGSGARMGSVLPAVAPYLPGAAALIFGYFFWYSTRSAPLSFQSRADARFLLSGDLPPRLLVGWLAVRGSRRLILVALVYMIAFGAYVPSAGLPWQVALGLGAGICCYAVLLVGASLLAFSVHLRVRSLPLGWIGIVAMVLGAAAVGSRFVPVLAPLRDPLAALPPGSWLMAAALGDAAPVALLAIVTAIVTGAGLALIGECQPELYAASISFFERRERVQQGRMGNPFGGRARRRTATARSAGGAELPAGTAVFFWKEWVTIRRSAGSGLMEALAVPLALVVGAVVGYVWRGPQWPVYMVLGYALWFFALLTTFGSVRLVTDLRMPIWWLAADPLWRRFAALTLARGMRWGVAMAVGLGATLVAGAVPPWVALPLAVAVIPLSWLLQALSLAVYSLLPAATDRRAAQMLRVFGMMGALGLIGAGAVPGIVSGLMPVAMIGMLIVLAAELLGLVAFASWRIEGNGLSFAREEAR